MPFNCFGSFNCNPKVYVRVKNLKIKGYINGETLKQETLIWEKL